MKTLQHKFVEFVPEILERDILYISITYCTTIHLCVCGCGNEVVTPLSPNDWELTFNGKTVSLYPSIGNWSFPCQSHYFIKNSVIRYAKKWSKEAIIENQRQDRKKKKRYFEKKIIQAGNATFFSLFNFSFPMHACLVI